MAHRDSFLNRRDFLTTLLASAAFAQAPLRDDSLQTRLEFLVRFIVSETIQQRGLKVILRSKLIRHGPRPHRQAPPRRLVRSRASESRETASRRCRSR